MTKSNEWIESGRAQLVPVHGGLSEPVDRVVALKHRSEFLEEADRLPSFRVNSADVSTVYRIADGALRGAGDTRWPFAVRFVMAWGVFLPVAWLLGFHWEGGLTWAWSGGAVYLVALSGILVWRFRSGAWRTIG